MNNEYLIEKDIKVRVCGQTGGTDLVFSRGSEENHKNISIVISRK
jgi:hypothetical protein